jgi:hypothetical protein
VRDGAPPKAPSPTQREAIDRELRRALSPKPPLRLAILGVAVARSDTHFASAEFQWLTKDRKPKTDRGIVVLMEAGGSWQLVIGPGTGYPEECTAPTVKAVRALLCPDPFAVIAGAR